MDIITDETALEALYGEVSAMALDKVRSEITPLYRQWIEASRFCILSSVGPEGTDGTPRGDDGPVVRVVDAQTLWMPDWRGNNRLDSLRNIVRDGRVSLMFLVPGSNNVVRVNGTAVLTASPEVTGSFEQAGRNPASVIVITVAEVYVQCAKALMRSRLWELDRVAEVPTVGELTRERVPDFDAEAYDDGYAQYAKPRMW